MTQEIARRVHPRRINCFICGALARAIPLHYTTAGRQTYELQYHPMDTGFTDTPCRGTGAFVEECGELLALGKELKHRAV